MSYTLSLANHTKTIIFILVVKQITNNTKVIGITISSFFIKTMQIAVIEKISNNQKNELRKSQNEIQIE